MLLWNWPRTCLSYCGARASTQTPGRSSMRVFLPMLLVCGLLAAQQTVRLPATQQPPSPPEEPPGYTFPITVQNVQALVTVFDKAGGYRSEERRVGKECRSRWSPANEKNRST